MHEKPSPTTISVLMRDECEAFVKFTSQLQKMIVDRKAVADALSSATGAVYESSRKGGTVCVQGHETRPSSVQQCGESKLSLLRSADNTTGAITKIERKNDDAVGGDTADNYSHCSLPLSYLGLEAVSAAATTAKSVFSEWFLYDLLRLELSPDDVGINGFANQSLKHLKKILDYHGSASRYSSLYSPSSAIFSRNTTNALKEDRSALLHSSYSDEGCTEEKSTCTTTTHLNTVSNSPEVFDEKFLADNNANNCNHNVKAKEEEAITPDEAIARICERTAQKLADLNPQLRYLNVDELTHSGIFSLLSAVTRGVVGDGCEMLNKRIRAVLDARRAAVIADVEVAAASAAASFHSKRVHHHSAAFEGSTTPLVSARGLASDDLWRSFNSEGASSYVGGASPHSRGIVPFPSSATALPVGDHHFSQLVRLLEEKVEVNRRTLAELDSGGGGGGARFLFSTRRDNPEEASRVAQLSQHCSSRVGLSPLQQPRLSSSTTRRSTRRVIEEALETSARFKDTAEEQERAEEDTNNTMSAAHHNDNMTCKDSADEDNSVHLDETQNPSPLVATCNSTVTVLKKEHNDEIAENCSSRTPIGVDVESIVGMHLGQLDAACESFLRHKRNDPSRVASVKKKIEAYYSEQCQHDCAATKDFSDRSCEFKGQIDCMNSELEASLSLIAQEHSKMWDRIKAREELIQSQTAALEAEMLRRAKHEAISRACERYTKSLEAPAGCGAKALSDEKADDDDDHAHDHTPAHNNHNPVGAKKVSFRLTTRAYDASSKTSSPRVSEGTSSTAVSKIENRRTAAAAEAYVEIIRECALECSKLLVGGYGHGNSFNSVHLARNTSSGGIGVSSIIGKKPSSVGPHNASHILTAGTSSAANKQGAAIFELSMAAAATSVALNGIPFEKRQHMTLETACSEDQRASKGEGHASDVSTTPTARVEDAFSAALNVFRRAILQDYHDTLTALGFNLIAELNRLERGIASSNRNKEQEAERDNGVRREAEPTLARLQASLSGWESVPPSSVLLSQRRGRGNGGSSNANDYPTAHAECDLKQHAEGVHEDIPSRPTCGGLLARRSVDMDERGDSDEEDEGVPVVSVTNESPPAHSPYESQASPNDPNASQTDHLVVGTVDDALRSAPIVSFDLSNNNHTTNNTCNSVVKGVTGPLSVPSAVNHPQEEEAVNMNGKKAKRHSLRSLPRSPQVPQAVLRLREQVRAVEDEYRELLATASRFGIALLNVDGSERKRSCYRVDVTTTGADGENKRWAVESILSKVVDVDDEQQLKEKKAAAESVVADALSGMLQPLLRDRYEAFVSACDVSLLMIPTPPTLGSGLPPYSDARTSGLSRQASGADLKTSSASSLSLPYRTPLIVEDPDGPLGVAVYEPRITGVHVPAQIRGPSRKPSTTILPCELHPLAPPRNGLHSRQQVSAPAITIGRGESLDLGDLPHGSGLWGSCMSLHNSHASSKDA